MQIVKRSWPTISSTSRVTVEVNTELLVAVNLSPPAFFSGLCFGSQWIACDDHSSDLQKIIIWVVTNCWSCDLSAPEQRHNMLSYDHMSANTKTSNVLHGLKNVTNIDRQDAKVAQTMDNWHLLLSNTQLFSCYSDANQLLFNYSVVVQVLLTCCWSVVGYQAVNTSAIRHALNW